MRLKDIGEFGFIQRIRHGCLVRPERVVRGIGDDAAAFRTNGERLSLVTTDLLVERIHFRREAISGRDLGHKSLAVNLSDIAAMGGIAREAFVSIAIPETCKLGYLDAIYDGVKDLAARHSVNILGGDTTASARDLVLSITVYGEVSETEILTRDVARPGDVIFTTGCLGDSRCGLELILNQIPAETKELEALQAAHLHPEPHLSEGRWLASTGGVHAAIDVSDGLSSDLSHILEESGVGARIRAEALPISEALRYFCRRFAKSPVEYALSGGEDYVLLVTAAADQAGRIARAFEAVFSRPLSAIGEITDSRVMELIRPNEAVTRIEPSGWDHFKRP
jgi:thiamine-monophosphate kinase